MINLVRVVLHTLNLQMKSFQRSVDMAKKLGGLGKGLGAIFIENDNEDNNGSVVV